MGQWCGAWGRSDPMTKKVTTFGRYPITTLLSTSLPRLCQTHAQVEQRAGGFSWSTFGSFNGTLINEQRIAQATLLRAGDTVSAWPWDPCCAFLHLCATSSVRGELTPAPSNRWLFFLPLASDALPGIGHGTIVVSLEQQPWISRDVTFCGRVTAQLLLQRPFLERSELTVRTVSPDSDVHLTAFQYL